jgi:lipoprotein NlpI
MKKVALNSLHFFACLASVPLSFSLLTSPGFSQTHGAFANLEDGIAKAKQGDIQGAIASYNKAIQLHSRYDAAYCNRGSLRRKLGDRHGALADFTKAIELNPQLDAAYNNRGIVKWEQGDYQGAIDDYGKAIQLNPQYDDAYCYRGIVKSDQGDSYAAILDFNLAIALNPKFDIAYRHRGIANLEHGRTQLAFADFNKAIDINPASSQNYAARGHAHFHNSQLPSTLADYRQALQLDPGGPVYYRYFVYNIRAKMGEEADARADLLLQMNQIPPGTGDEWPRTIGKFLTDQIPENLLITAADVSGDETKTRQQRCEAWYYAGVKRLQRGETANARDCFRECRATAVRNYVEYRLAAIELKKLGVPVP